MLDELLIKNPDAEFVQLQINYADWESANIASRDCYEVARKHGKPIVVMEPIKGGILANPPEKVANLFKEANPEASLASWAIRYAASLDGIMTVLSGMSDIAQMKDNISYMKDFRPLDAEEEEIIKRAQTIFREAGAIPCTACQYCTGGCPAEIRIPEIIRAYNTYKLYNDLDQSKQIYNIATSNGGKVSDCVHCAQCVGACPQHLHIMDYLMEAAKVLD
jgi:predicted aldo/keto reductase-like oxidoreductase